MMTSVEVGAAVACYSALLFFASASAFKMSRYARVPLGLRWELYHVPSEGQREHGGSFLEETEWWKKPPSRSRASEMKELFEEMLFIKRLYRNKRSVWRFSFLFHGGIYLILGWLALLLLGGVTQLFFFPVSLVSWSAYPTLASEVLFYLTIGFGYTGVAAAAVGSLGLLVLRYRDDRIRDLSSPVDYFNLLFAFAVIAAGAVALTADPTFNVARSLMTYLICGGGAIAALPAQYLQTLSEVATPQILVQLALLLSFVVYIPFTRILHFFGKYFTYHKVLWDSEPSMQDGRFRRELGPRVGKNMEMSVPWSAPHIREGANWKEVAGSG